MGLDLLKDILSSQNLDSKINKDNPLGSKGTIAKTIGYLINSY